MRWITRAYLSPLRNFLFPSGVGPYNGDYAPPHYIMEDGSDYLMEDGASLYLVE